MANTIFLSVVLEQGYDPFNPGVVTPQSEQNGKPGSGDLSGALEMVNKAIEEVRSEVEREKRKLSRIGDEPYSPTEKTTLPSSETVKRKAVPTHMAYDPGSYQMTSEDYSPTPGCSKYTLDSGDLGNNSNSMEYVPTLMKKPSSRTPVDQLPSPPPSPKYSNSTSFSKCKYTVDNSRPSTDMEYDPLSNYTAGIAVKSKRDKVSQGVKGDESKKCKLPRSNIATEEYVVVAKKPRPQEIDYKKYTISDSDEESSGTEYRPTSLSSLQQRKENCRTLRDVERNERPEKTERTEVDLLEDLDFQAALKWDSTDKKKVASQSSHEKNGKSERLCKVDKEVSKKTGSNKSGTKDKGLLKNSNQLSTKKDGKSHVKREDCKNRDKGQREGKDEKRGDAKLKSAEKVRTDSSKVSRDTVDAMEGKKAKISDKVKDPSKLKNLKNGTHDGYKKEKDIKKMQYPKSKDKVKQSLVSSQNGKKPKSKHSSRSLSHADLFGDESADEVEPLEGDEDEEQDVVVIGKSPLSTGRSSKRKASELTPSSSDDESDHLTDSRAVGKKEDVSLGIDYSVFKDDFDFDSDPMEECLRIFNESKDVKKEDKGRQAKQVADFFYSHIFCAQFKTNVLINILLTAYKGSRGGEKHRELFDNPVSRTKEESVSLCCQRKCKHFVTLRSLAKSTILP